MSDVGFVDKMMVGCYAGERPVLLVRLYGQVLRYLPFAIL